MQDLMIYIERIVRPVHALESRKLRMRRELLAHTQTAFEEERAQGVDETTALARAKCRLGEPAELTRELEQSVSKFDRLVLLNLPLLSGLDDKTTAQRIDFAQWKSVEALNRGPAIHALLLMGAACVIPMIVGFMLPTRIYSPSPQDRVMVYPRLVFAAALLLNCLITLPCSRFAVAVVKISPGPHRLRAIGYATVVIVMQLLATILANYRIAGHMPSIGQLGLSLSAALFFLIVIVAAARWFVKAHTPYEEWLMLDID